MKKILSSMMVFILAATAALAQAQPAPIVEPVPPPPKPPEVLVSDLALEGEIQGENIMFTLTLKAEARQKGAVLPLTIGDVAYLDGKLPRGSELIREGDRYLLRLSGGGFFSRGRQAVSCRFASRPLKNGDWRSTSFVIPGASVRKLSVICDRDDLQIKFPGALDIQRQKNKDGKMQVTAFLGISDKFEVTWKPEVKKLESELVVSCDANTIASASVGALRVDTIFTYRIIQGSLNKLSFQLPDLNVTQVQGEDIQDWRIDRADPAKPKLLVTLSRPKEDLYRLRVEGEMVLPQFPCKFNLPALAPESVLRTSGFLMIGTDSAIKLQVNKAGGLTQVDQAAFPAATLDAKAGARPAPMRSTFAYQYANMPYTLGINADDIITAFSADEMMVLKLSDNELTFDASIQIDVKDAPARELLIETDPDPGWTVTSITGQNVSEADTDVRDEAADPAKKKVAKRTIYVPFKQAVTGMAKVSIRMEKTLKPNEMSFAAPKFEVQGARSERGYVIVAAEKGIRLKTDKVTSLREVHSGSAPTRVEDAQQAFRFKESKWTLSLGIERTLASIHSEVFHLVSLGEGVMYCSAAITYHIGGAPVQEFKVKVPKTVETIEFTGADIEGWTRDGDVCTVRLQTRIMGDYTLLVTWDRQYNFYEGAEVSVGDVETAGTDSEVGYLAIASAASVKTPEPKDKLPASIIPIDRSEIPTAYSTPIADPILAAYKYVSRPHAFPVQIRPYKTEQLLRQVADFIRLSTSLTKDGEAKTTATYFIKNASRQYLVVNLPEGVKLWTIKYIDANGQKEAALSQKSAQGYLIPVSRPRDPNTPIRVEIVYAESHGALGFWRSGFKGVTLQAPALPDAHATFASWQVEVPEKFSIAEARGNMSSRLNQVFGGFSGVARKVWRLGRAVVDGWGGHHTVKGALSGGIGWNRVAEFTRSVNLSGSDRLTLDLFVVPALMGSDSSARGITVMWILALVLLVAGMVKQRPVWRALGWTLVVFGGTYSALGRSVLAVLVALLVLLILTTPPVRKLIGAILNFVWRGVKAVLTFPARLFRRKQDDELNEEPPPFEENGNQESGVSSQESEGNQTGEPGKQGYAMVRLLALMAAIALAIGTLAAGAAPVVESLKIAIEAPGTGKDIEQSAKITAVLEFSTRGAESFVVIAPSCVLVDYDLNSGSLSIASRPTGYVLDVRDAGKYRATLKYQAPVEFKDGQWKLDVLMVPNLMNAVTLKLPEAGLDIQSESAVLFKTEEKKDSTSAEAVFGPVTTAHIVWKPRMRKTKLEETVFFSDVSSFVGLQAGVVEVANLVRYQIAQGEVKELKVQIPAGMSVTAVRAPGLATWSFDPDKRLLDAILEKAVSGDFTLTIVTQIACEGLPYSATLGALQALDAARQRGSIAIAAPDMIQVRIEDVKGLNPMNIEDFSKDAVLTAGTEGRVKTAMTIRRAFRFNQPEEVSAKIQTEKVLSEIRVNESGTLSIADERIVLATRLELAITKAGIFSVELGIPADFDVETLTGKDVSHWDEIKEGGHGVVVHFNRQVTDGTEINAVIGRTEKGIEQKITVPRVTVKDAAKQAGKLTVSGERGVRLMVDSHTGVDIKKASEEGIKQTGVLVFDILRPTWEIILKTEVMAPQVKPEVLQLVDLTEGMLQCRAFFHYKIENAGVKTFRIKSPVPGTSLSMTGRNIANVTEIEKEKGIWQVDLHNKVEDTFAMTATYQIPYAPAAGGVKILPMQTLDAEEQRGYVVVTCGGRVQVEPKGELKGLKVEDPRNVPAMFGAGDLSGAIQCYRTIRPDYLLELSVVRHDEAKVLPASISDVQMTSTISTSGKLLTRVATRLTVGNLRFLKMKLPGADDSLWTVLVNGKEVSTSRDGELYCIPLEEQTGEQVTLVDMIYAGSVPKRRLSGEQKFDAPKFIGLPLNNIEWTFFVPEGRKYYGFGGTMDYTKGQKEEITPFTADYYERRNDYQKESNLRRARQELETGEQLLKAGKQNVAKKALQQALNYSQGQADLNEDARIQFRNVQKQQVKMGLVNRRDAVRYSKNIVDEQQMEQMQGFQNGEYTPEYASKVERGLSEKDSSALDRVANKLLDQQALAAGVVTAINVTMPEQGKALRFARAMQVDPDSELNVTFKSSTGWLGGVLKALWPAVLLFFVFWSLSSRRKGAAV